MSAAVSHRLEGLEPDNLLAFLALLGLLRSLESADQGCADKKKLFPRVAWDVEMLPLRPVLFLARPMARDELCEQASRGLAMLSTALDIGERKDLNHSRAECRVQLMQAAQASGLHERNLADVLAALMSDAAIKQDNKKESIDPTPLCLLFGQGHQHFLERLASVPRTPVQSPRRRGRKADTPSAAEFLAETLFQPWHRRDPTFSFRWDPEEDVRYALMAGDPTDKSYKLGTQHGANQLAAVGLPALTLVPEQRGGRVRPAIIGGIASTSGFSFAWPIWREPATLNAIRALLCHPDLRIPGGLRHLGVSQVVVARRISVGKFMNFSRARAVDDAS